MSKGNFGESLFVPFTEAPVLALSAFNAELIILDWFLIKGGFTTSNPSFSVIEKSGGVPFPRKKTQTRRVLSVKTWVGNEEGPGTGLLFSTLSF